MRASTIITTVMVTCILLLTASADAEVRSFKDKNGRSIEGEILAVHGERVEMKVSGKKFIFPISNLSADDQAHVKKWASVNKTYKLDFAIRAVEDPQQRKKGNDPSPINVNLPNLPPGVIPGRSQSDRDVKAMTTGWRYNVTVQNRSGEDLGKLSVNYNVIVRNKLAIQGEGNAESHSIVVGTMEIPALENTRRAEFATDWLEMRERDWESERTKAITDGKTGRVNYEKYWVDYSESTQLDGMWIKVFVDARQVAEWQSEGKAIKKAEWSDETKLVGTPRSVSKSGGGTPGTATSRDNYLPHEDLQPIPKMPEKFKGQRNVGGLWQDAVTAGRKYREADKSRKPSERRKALAVYEAALAAYKAAISK